MGHSKARRPAPTRGNPAVNVDVLGIRRVIPHAASGVQSTAAGNPAALSHHGRRRCGAGAPSGDTIASESGGAPPPATGTPGRRAAGAGTDPVLRPATTIREQGKHAGAARPGRGLTDRGAAVFAPRTLRWRPPGA